MKRFSFACLVAAVAGFGCGDNDHHNTPDAHVYQDAPPIDAFVECNYNEAHDTTNDYQAASGYMIENSGLTFSGGGATRTICGTVNNGHFDDVTNFSVDIDNYLVTFDHDSDVLVTLIADAGGVGATEDLGVFAVDHADTSKGLGGGSYTGDHAVFSGHIPAGTYEFSVEAYDNQDETASLPYKLRITTDNPTTRCAKATAAANYTEANDGASNNGNDMVAIDYSMNPRRVLTAAADSPEPTNLTLASGTNYRISGSSAAVSLTGSYFDRDTYLVTTGSDANQLAIRLNWGSTTADLDYYLFPENGVNPVGSAAKMKLGEDEFATIAVSPNTKYWLWVGGFSSSTALPATYDATICSEKYTPM